MKFLKVILPLVLVVVAATAYSQSLGDLAKKEKERRAKIKTEVKVLTNDDTARFKSAPITTGTLPEPELQQKGDEGEKRSDSGDTRAKSADASANEPVDLKGRPESFWRQTLSDARQKIKDLENESNVLTLKLADLQNQFYRESSGFKQQDIQREIQKTFYQQDLNKQNLETARSQLQDLEGEARKSGALPGWLQPQKP